MSFSHAPVSLPTTAALRSAQLELRNETLRVSWQVRSSSAAIPFGSVAIRDRLKNQEETAQESGSRQ
jgi:hypothetical protein